MSSARKEKRFPGTFGPHKYTHIHIPRRGHRVEWENYPPAGTRVLSKFGNEEMRTISMQVCGMLGVVDSEGFEHCGFPADYEYVGPAEAKE